MSWNLDMNVQTNRHEPDMRKCRSGHYRGFTLIEMAISILILGLLIVPAGQGYKVWREQQKYNATHERLETIKEAMAIFIQINRYLPCPAPRNVQADAATFGSEQDCRAGVPAGTVTSNGTNIGVVPVRTLGLPDDFIADAWGYRFTYAASIPLTDPPNKADPNYPEVGIRTPNGSRINFQDTNGNSLVTPAGSLMYVIVSHGPDGAGGFSAADGVRVNCQAGRADQENCDDDDVFTYTGEYARSFLGTHFDDLISYEVKDFIDLSSIKHYDLIPFDCVDDPDLQAAFVPNANAEECATAFFSGADIYIDALGGEFPADGLEIFDANRISETEGRLVVRATLPTTARNDLTATKWREPILGAIYIDNVLVSQALLLDPSAVLEDGFGFSSLLMGEADIQVNAAYNIKVYLYSLGNQALATKSAWVGSARFKLGAAAPAFNGTAFVEVMEIEDF